jgi:hypothetical protein
MGKFEILGIEVKDVITGLKGVITARASYITGCDQYLVQPQGDGKNYPDATWIYEERLKPTKNGLIVDIADVRDPTKGCDVPAPKK